MTASPLIVCTSSVANYRGRGDHLEVSQHKRGLVHLVKMGSGQSTQVGSSEEADWSLTIRVHKTVTYHMKKGDTSIIKKTGYSEGKPVSYSVDAKTREMFLISDSGEKIPAGHDGDIDTLGLVSSGMLREIENYTGSSICREIRGQVGGQ